MFLRTGGACKHKRLFMLGINVTWNNFVVVASAISAAFLAQLTELFVLPIYFNSHCVLFYASVEAR